MSKLRAQGNASGTGVFTLETPATNTDRTITLPDSTGTLLSKDATGNASALTIKDASSTQLTLERDGNTTQIAALVMKDGSGDQNRISSTDSNLVFGTGATNTERMRIDNSGNVGIGVTPESWNTFTALQIGTGGSIPASGDSNYIEMAGNSYYQTGYKYNSTADASLYQQDNGQHKFKVAPSGTADTAITWTTGMTIANSGVSTFGNAFGWGGSNSVVVSGVTEGRINIDNNDTGTKYCVSFYNPNGNVGKITTNGTSTSYATTSDYRLKENNVPMSASIDRLKQLNPINFNFVADATTVVDGFLAHEVQAVVPEAVSGEKDAMTTEEYEVTPAVEATYDEEGNELTPAVEAVMGTREVEDYQGIDQSKLVPLLTSALQEAVAKIEALEQRVTALEGGTV